MIGTVHAPATAQAAASQRGACFAASLERVAPKKSGDQQHCTLAGLTTGGVSPVTSLAATLVERPNPHQLII